MTHRCHRRHRSYRAYAHCAWPRAVWVLGDGPWAFVTPCGYGTAISLWPTREAAESCKSMIDRWGCGAQCTPRRHYITRLELK